MFRIIDANLNRVCEGLRVIEEILRFEFNDSFFSKALKEIRHNLRKKFSDINFLRERDSINDCGKKFNKIEGDRNSILDILKANFLRIEEGLRVLEEFIKLEEKFFKNIDAIKSFRFTIYNLEKEILIKYFNLTKLKNHAIIKANKDINSILNYITKNNITSIQLENLTNNIKELKEIKNFCLNKNILLFIRNSLELAIILNSDGIVIDKSYYNFHDIKNNYKKAIGYIVEDIIDCYDYDFFIIENINFIDTLLEKNKILIVKQEDYDKVKDKRGINICKIF